MKVTAVSTLITAGGHANWIFVKVETDGGITGWGEATLEWRDGPVCAEVENFSGLVVDFDQLRIESCHSDWERVVRVTSENDQRPQETVPDVDEREDSQCAQPRPDQRENDRPVPSALDGVRDDVQ